MKYIAYIQRRWLLLLFLVLSPLELLQAQDLEPRRWSHLPMGLQVFGVTTGWTDGEILFDPVLLIEDATFDVSVVGAGYAYAFEMAGKSARVDFGLPYASGRWEGLVDGEFTSVRRRGFMDPRIRLSVNLIGAPPLSGGEYMQYRHENPVTTTVGAALAVTLPLGEYQNDRLINLGGNRFVVRPQLGVLHQRRNWQFELTGSAFLYQENDEFWNGNELKQDPLLFFQGHIIRTFRPGWWASLSGGYGYGGRSEVNGVPKGDDDRTRYIAVSMGMPINRQQSLKFTYFSSDTHINLGKNTDAILLSWSMNWGL